jgi:hypothetical protein
VPNAYWNTRPGVTLAPGTYTVIDSDPSTWAQNAGTGGAGHIRVETGSVSATGSAPPAPRPAAPVAVTSAQPASQPPVPSTSQTGVVANFPVVGRWKTETIEAGKIVDVSETIFNTDGSYTTPATWSAPAPPAWPSRWWTACKLTPKVLETCAQGCEQLAAMPDVIGEIIGMKQQPSGIRVGQMRVPIGVFGMIYESRPNVTIEAASLAIKSGNACILRGGSEAIESNKALARLVQQALAEAGLPQDAVQLVQTTDREAVGQLITMPQYVDVIIPRGGKGLIERISRDAKVPVIKHLDGNCHTYVDDPCDIAMAVKVADNAKTQKYSPCNARAEGLLVARGVAAEFLPRIGAVLPPRAWRCAAAPRRWRFCSVPGAKLVDATEQDWSEEYLAPIISVKVVAGWTRPSPTSTAIPATTPTPSSRATTCTRQRFCARWIRPA